MTILIKKWQVMIIDTNMFLLKYIYINNVSQAHYYNECCHLHNENVCIFKEGHAVIYWYQKTFIMKTKKKK